MASSYSLFRLARQNAKRRGIVFDFQYEEWIAWWQKNLGPHWKNKRGKGKIKYHMARFNDCGPYAIWNVKCITHSQNSSEIKNSGWHHTQEFKNKARRWMLGSKNALGSKRPDYSSRLKSLWQTRKWRKKMSAAIAASNRRRAYHAQTAK